MYHVRNPESRGVEGKIFKNVPRKKIGAGTVFTIPTPQKLLRHEELSIATDPVRVPLEVPSPSQEGRAMRGPASSSLITEHQEKGEKTLTFLMQDMVFRLFQAAMSCITCGE